MLLVLVPVTSYAQESLPPQGEPVATVNLQDASFVQDGHTFTIDFDISNRVGVQSGIKYGVALVETTQAGQVIVDEHVYDEVVSLGENSRVHRTVNYTAPSPLTGQYALVLNSKSASGFPFGTTFLGMVTIPRSNVQQALTLHSGTCYLTIQGEPGESRYTPLQGIDIGPGESLVSNCQVENTGNVSVTARPLFETFARTTFGDRVVTEGGDTASITIAPKETRLVSTVLPRASTPQAYDTKLSYGEGSNEVIYHYVVRGGSGTIQNIVLDKDAYTAGESAEVSFFWSKAADTFDGARTDAPTALVSPTFTISLTSGNGESCGEPHTVALDPARPTLVANVPITSACDSPEVLVTLADAQFGVLSEARYSTAGSAPTNDTDTSSLPPGGSDGSDGGGGKMLLIVLLVGALVAVAVYIARPYYQKRMILPKDPLVILALILSSFFFGTHEVSADTFTMSTTTNGITRTVTYTVNIDKSSYTLGENIHVTGSGQVNSDCNNACVDVNGLCRGAGLWIDALDGVAIPRVYIIASQSQTMGLHAVYGSADIAAPTTTGAHTLRVTGTMFYPVEAMLTSVTLPFSVSTPTPPVLTNPTHSSITNSAATLGATIALSGGSAITDRGTCWGITNPPPLSGCSSLGGTAMGAFIHSRTGLPSGTTIYYRGYAENVVGRGYSPISSFMTTGGVTPGGEITTLPNCDIAIGASNCSATMSWTATVPVTVQECTGVSYGSFPAGTGSTAITVPHSALGTTCLSLKDLSGTQLTNGYGTAYCVVGSTWNGTTCVANANPSGTLTAPANCTITSGQSTCTVKATWTTQNATGVKLEDYHTETGIADFLTAQNSMAAPGFDVTVEYTNPAYMDRATRLRLTDENDTVLDQRYVLGSCAPGTTWNGLSCAGTPGTPTGLIVGPGSCGTGLINVSWNSVSGATSYKLYDGASLIYSGGNTGYSHTGLAPLSSHSYTVVASNGAGDSGATAPIVKSAPNACVPGTPSAPMAIGIACNWTYLDVTWPAVTGATSYNLKDSGQTIYIGSNPWFKHTGLTASSTHSYSVIATNSAGSSTPSLETVTTAMNVCAPPAPTGLTATPASCGSNQISVAWSTSTNATSYIVSQNNAVISSLRLYENGTLLPIPHSNHADIRNIGLGRYSHWGSTTTQSIRFAASDNTDPRTNGRSYTYTINGGTGPGSPVNMASAVSDGGYAWRIVQNFGTTPDSGTYTTLYTGGANSFAHSGLTPGATYNYTVAATNAGGMSSYSSTVEATAPASCSAANLVSENLAVTGTYKIGSTLDLSATVRNVGTIATPNFRDTFTYQWGGTSGAWTLVPSGSISKTGLAPGASSNDTKTFSLTQGGRLYIQHCVDAGGGTGDVDEGTAETPNCSVSPAIEISSYSSCAGTTNANCVLTNNIPHLGTSGTCAVGYTNTCTYSCSDGTWTEVANTCTPPSINEYKVCLADDPSDCTNAYGNLTTSTGTPLTIFWDASADNCSAVSGPGFTLPGGGVVGSVSITANNVPSTTDRFQIACRYGSGVPVQSWVDVTTLQDLPEITADLTTVPEGGTVELRWDTNNGAETSCTLTGGTIDGSAALGNGSGTNETGTENVTIEGRTTFILTCGSLSSVKTIEIIPIGWEG
jgi:hypothetical protein